MNPTLEVQITAKLDKLDAGLKVAEAKVNQSAQTMGKVGEKAGANFGATFAANLPMMMVATAIAHTVGKGILQAVKDSNAGKSGHDIGLGLAQGIVDGAKSLPVVGVVFGILDEMVNGAERAAELITKKVGGAIEKRIDSTKTLMDMLKSSAAKTDDIKQATAAGKDPLKMLEEEKITGARVARIRTYITAIHSTCVTNARAAFKTSSALRNSASSSGFSGRSP